MHSAAAVTLALRSIGIYLPSLFRWVCRSQGKDNSGARISVRKVRRAGQYSQWGRRRTNTIPTPLHGSSVHSTLLQAAAYRATIPKPFNFSYTSLQFVHH